MQEIPEAWGEEPAVFLWSDIKCAYHNFIVFPARAGRTNGPDAIFVECEKPDHVAQGRPYCPHLPACSHFLPHVCAEGIGIDPVERLQTFQHMVPWPLSIGTRWAG